MKYDRITLQGWVALSPLPAAILVEMKSILANGTSTAVSCESKCIIGHEAGIEKGAQRGGLNCHGIDVKIGAGRKKKEKKIG